MKSIKKLFAMLGVMLAMSVVVMPLAGWTSAASADEAETAVQTVAIGGVEPLFGGSENDTLYFENDEWVKFKASAGNWIWPSADEAVVTVESGSSNAHFSFEVTFIWKDGHTTYWRYPRQMNIGTGEPPDLLKMDSEGKYKVKLTMNCNDSQLLGDAGSKWACDHIYLKGFARIGNEPMQSCEIGPVYF